jgi:quinol monooxygenase YgiN
MSPFYLIAEIFPDPNKLSEAKAAFAELVEETRKEPGCLLYELVAEEGTDCWVMIEKFESKAAWDSHMLQPHVLKMNELSQVFTRAKTNLRFFTSVEAEVKQG